MIDTLIKIVWNKWMSVILPSTFFSIIFFHIYRQEGGNLILLHSIFFAALAVFSVFYLREEDYQYLYDDLTNN